jgi:hypothetical protein
VIKQVYKRVTGKEEHEMDMFPTTMLVNAFRGFLDEFQHQLREEERDAKKKRRLTPSDKERGAEKRREEETNKKARRRRRPPEEEPLAQGKHLLYQIDINIPTACEVCNSFMWRDKALLCKGNKIFFVT